MAKYCAICNTKLGFIDISCSTADNNEICGNCVMARGLTKIEDGVEYPDFGKVIRMTVDEVRDYASAEVKKQREAVRGVEVTTLDVNRKYTTLIPLFVQVSNKGLFTSEFEKLSKKYELQFKEEGLPLSGGASTADFGALWGQWSASQNSWKMAFYICLEELRKEAAAIGADAVVGMRMDIDLDTNGIQYFYMQMYGTAVKYTD